MARGSTFRFGASGGTVQLGPSSGGASLGDTLRERARRAEAEGYARITVPDHVVFPIAPIAAMMAMADATETIHVSTSVLDNNVRHPVVLAKEAAMIDVLSGGRFELGIGAGSLPFEHEAFLGIPAAPVGERVRRLDEALQVIAGMWGPSAFSFDGEFYRCESLDGLPKPAQQPHPPIRVGGFGKRLLAVAARRADTVSMLLRTWPNQMPGAAPAGAARMSVPTDADLVRRIAWIREAAGVRFDDLELELMLWGCTVSADPSATAASLVPLLGSSPEEVLAAPDVAIGSVSFIAERLDDLRESCGITSFLGVPPEVVAVLSAA